MTRRTSCPNLNHRNTNPSVRFCPNCGEVVGEKVAIKRCSQEQHATRRRNGELYCVHCGERLRK